jgi:hypothetical protein
MKFQFSALDWDFFFLAKAKLRESIFCLQLKQEAIQKAGCHSPQLPPALAGGLNDNTLIGL